MRYVVTSLIGLTLAAGTCQSPQGLTPPPVPPEEIPNRSLIICSQPFEISIEENRRCEQSTILAARAEGLVVWSRDDLEIPQTKKVSSSDPEFKQFLLNLGVEHIFIIGMTRIGWSIDYLRTDQTAIVTRSDGQKEWVLPPPPNCGVIINGSKEIKAQGNSLELSNHIIESMAFSGDCRRITMLHMNRCGLSQIPKAVWQLDSLKHLYLDGNNLTSIEISERVQLERLSLNENQVSVFKPGNRSTVDQVFLRKNSMARFPSEILKLQPKYLDFSRNAIEDLGSLPSNSSVQSLKLAFNRLQNCGNLQNLSKLRSLGLEYNRIDHCALPSSIESLGLDGNAFVSIESITGATRLKNLAMPCNPLNDLSTIQRFGSLELLDIRYTLLEPNIEIPGVTIWQGNKWNPKCNGA